MYSLIEITLGEGVVEIEYNYQHYEDPTNNTIELLSIGAWKFPEKHLREATLNVIKAQIHFQEKAERDAVIVNAHANFNGVL